jgi:hypothetical protein
MSSPDQRARRKLERTAYHEAGHAVAHFWLGLRIRYATISPNRRALGTVCGYKYPKHLRPDLDWTPRIEQRLRHEIIALLAGGEAERRKFRYATGTGSDSRAATDLMEQLAPFEIQSAWWSILKHETRNLIRTRWSNVRAVARALIAHKTLRGSMVKQVIRDDWPH